MDLDALFDDCKAEEGISSSSPASEWNTSWGSTSGPASEWNTSWGGSRLPGSEWNTTWGSNSLPVSEWTTKNIAWHDRPTYYGVISRLGQSSGGNNFGFLRCKETFAMYKHDIRIYQHNASSPLQVGAVMSFQLYQDQGERPCASTASVVADVEKYRAVREENQCEILDGAVHSGVIVNNPLSRDQINLLIQCKDLHGVLGSHAGIYIPKERTSGLTPGLMVHFSLEMIERGGLQACNITAAHGEQLGMIDATGRGNGKGMPVTGRGMPDTVAHGAGRGVGRGRGSMFLPY
eukprot:gnl/MRDRNA2_/MRDRNA2_18129_c0_seq2.p1 gnl/MRDRNA2_/MRDRNA2_18129_c0~~gnl/MRDRNA2_/MRDRNA2_18129_c0_seq2.p1  ORF type:complete len:291 (-),score=38.22 gnl/MRDRNA2_/MRDRNA2_18129_c0_seq2:111-983(-)